MGCFTGRLMSSARDQKLFCEICLAFNCSFHEFVGDKVVSPSYSSTMLAPPSFKYFLKLLKWFKFHVAGVTSILIANAIMKAFGQPKSHHGLRMY